MLRFAHLNETVKIHELLIIFQRFLRKQKPNKPLKMQELVENNTKVNSSSTNLKRIENGERLPGGERGIGGGGGEK